MCKIKSIPLLFFLFLSNLLIAQPVINSVDTKLSNIPVYSKFEIDVDLTADFTNAYDYSQINLKAVFISPTNKIDTVDGFFFQNYIITNPTTGSIKIDDNPIWKIRFTPIEVGEWQYKTYCIDANGASNIITRNFECTSSNSKGFVSKANNMFMKHDDGSQFFAIGENLCWNMSNSGSTDVANTFVNYTEWLDTLTAYNGNFFRLWMADWSFAIEWKDTPLRDYTNRQDYAFYLDWLVDFAKTKDTYIELCLNHHGQFVSSVGEAIWNENPYNSANGGPCKNSYDFFTNTTAKNHYKNRLRYINARWGYSTSIFAWEQFNEMDLIGDYWSHRTDIADWTIEMAEYIKSIDVNNHLNSTSFVQDNQGFDIWNADVIDYTQTHYYSADAEIEQTLNNRTQFFLNEFDKPTKIGEYSLSTNGANVVIGFDDNAIHIHNAGWSTALSGSFGISMSWWWKWYIHNQNLQSYKHFEEIGNFISSINLLEYNLTPHNFVCEADTNTAFHITPTSGWGLAPENNFTVNANRTLTPTANNLSTFLYGDIVNSSLKNPPTFNVNYPHDDYFTVKTGNASEHNPTIEIWLDGTKILDQTAVVNTNYTIAVSAGAHQIFVDNKGHDWIKIEQYYSSYETTPIKAKSNGLICSKAAYGWVHNRDYNWEYLSENGEPNSISNARIIIPGLNNGDYDIIFTNTLTGETVSKEIGESTSGTLFANIPDMLWDFAFKITETTSTSLTSINKKNNAISVFPNPVYSTITINGVKNNANVTIVDLCGRKVLSKTLTSNTVDLSNLNEGIYIINISTENENSNFKIIKK